MENELVDTRRAAAERTKGALSTDTKRETGWSMACALGARHLFASTISLSGLDVVMERQSITLEAPKRQRLGRAQNMSSPSFDGLIGPLALLRTLRNRMRDARETDRYPA